MDRYNESKTNGPEKRIDEDKDYDEEQNDHKFSYSKKSLITDFETSPEELLVTLNFLQGTVVDSGSIILESAQIRNTIRTIAESRSTKKNAEIFEKHVFDSSVRLAKQISIEPISISNQAFTELYTNNAYNLLYKLKPDNLFQLIKSIEKDLIEWNDPFFEEYLLKRIAEENIDKTISEEIAEGLHTCHKCGSKKTSSYQLQLRSSDEGSTNFIICVKCSSMWKQNN
jgi:DNA-directed RNA polymerase subunit M/transcription elongation factor TFIIS